MTNCFVNCCRIQEQSLGVVTVNHKCKRKECPSLSPAAKSQRTVPHSPRRMDHESFELWLQEDTNTNAWNDENSEVERQLLIMKEQIRTAQMRMRG